jgi:hypothetical protein
MARWKGKKMEKAKCAKCGALREFEKLPKKFCCSECGILNTPRPETAGTGAQACGCLLPEKFEWKMPSGVLEPVGSEPLYTTADDATGLTRKEWTETFGYDPVIVIASMRKLGKEGKEGYYNTSTLGKEKPK